MTLVERLAKDDDPLIKVLHPLPEVERWFVKKVRFFRRAAEANTHLANTAKLARPHLEAAIKSLATFAPEDLE
eukprot:2197343-Pyramimonas_sp.AAC.1